MKLRVGTAFSQPFVKQFCIPRSAGCLKYGIAGIANDVLNYYQEKLSLSLQEPIEIIQDVFTESDQSVYAKLNVTADWYGLFSGLLSDRIDIIAPVVGADYHRAYVADFVFPPIFTSLPAFCSNPSRESFKIDIFETFPLGILGLWLLSLLLIVLTLSWDGSIHLKIAASWVYPLLFKKRAKSTLGRTLSSKLLVTVYCFTSCYVGLRYFGAQVVKIATPKLGKIASPFNEISELPNLLKTTNFTLLLIRHELTAARFLSSDTPVMRAVKQELNRESMISVGTIEEGFRILNELPDTALSSTSNECRFHIRDDSDIAIRVNYRYGIHIIRVSIPLTLLGILRRTTT